MKDGTESPADFDTPVEYKQYAVNTGSAGGAAQSLLVCFSGKIGSGKTAISRAVARRLDCGRTSFGGYLRKEAVRRGYDPDCRQVLQDIGQSLIEHDAESFCRNVLADGGFVPGEDFVIDGIRHVDVLPHLVQIAAPSEVRLIFLDADAKLRSNRVAERSRSAREEFDRVADHAVEAHMERELPMVAHKIVDSSLAEQQVVEVCLGIIGDWKSTGSRVPSLIEILEISGRLQRK